LYQNKQEKWELYILSIVNNDLKCVDIAQNPKFKLITP
jgi:hypothetical protein